MIHRQIAFSVAASGAVSPALPQYGGVKGEHNETALCFTIDAALVGDDDVLRLAFTSGDGAILSSDLIEDYEQTDDGLTFSYPLPQILTLPAGQLCVRVVVSTFGAKGCEEKVFRSNEAVIWFDEAAVENGTPFWTGVSEMLRRTVTAKETVVAAQAEMQAALADAKAAAISASSSSGQAQAAKDAAKGYADTALQSASASRTAAVAAEQEAGKANVSENRAAVCAAQAANDAAVSTAAKETAVAAKDAAEAASSKAATIQQGCANYASTAEEYASEAQDAAEDADVARSEANSARTGAWQASSRASDHADAANMSAGLAAQAQAEANSYKDAARVSAENAAASAFNAVKSEENCARIASAAGSQASAAEESAQKAQIAASNAGMAGTQAVAASDSAQEACEEASAHADTATAAAEAAVHAKSAAENASSDAAGYADQAQAALKTIESIADDGIPDYWDEHLAEKIAAIKALQDEGGKDCFSFVVMTDLHYPSNLGKCSPAIARRIMDECGIRYALCLGDTQSRGARATKEETVAELDSVAKMLSPLDGHLLRTQGNHDGAYGTYDIDGDGTIESGETYVYDLPPAELYGQIYRKVAALGNTHFDESGTAYYVDDTANKVRFILLNTHCNEWAQNEDGTNKFPNIHNFRFTQAQYDFLVNEALTNGIEDGWSVIIGSHVPVCYNEYYAEYWGGAVGDTDGGDNGLMRQLLSAFNAKTAFAGTFDGMAAGGAAYTNLADTSDVYWKTDTRINSSKVETTSSAEGQIVSNYFPVAQGQIVRVKGMTFDNNFKFVFYTEKPQDTATGTLALVASYSTNGIYTIENDVFTYHLFDYDASGAQFSGCESYVWCRICGTPSNGAENIVITIDEPIIEAAHGYDYVAVDADFTTAKGEIVGCFAGHTHADYLYSASDHGVNIITTRCDAQQENGGAGTALYDERVAETVTEQSFDVFTVNKKARTITATKIGAGDDRTITY